MRTMLGGLLAAILIVTSACRSDTEPLPTIETKRSPVEPPSPTTTIEDEPAELKLATCTLASPTSVEVALVDDGDDLKVTWAGQPVAPTGTTGFYVSVYDANGNGGQMGVKYLDGEQIAYFSDALEYSGIIGGAAVVSGTTVTATFPSPDFRIAKWNASTTLAGRDVGNCETAPFPG